MKPTTLTILFLFAFHAIHAAPTPEQLLQAVPAECPDAAYLQFNKTGDRRAWEEPYGQRTETLTSLISAEKREGQGRFLTKIAEFIEAICDMRTWTMNAHDGNLKSFHGQQPLVELGSARLGLLFAQVIHQFGDKLPPDLIKRARAELERRIFVPYLATAAEAKADPTRRKFSINHWWFRTNNNWNAVCHSLVARAALLYYPEGSTERSTIIAAAVDAAPYFISGFTSDGYCSEGAGYWNYGFGHFLELGLALREAPEKIDLFRDPKTRTIAEYGFAYKLTPQVSPLFADGSGSPNEKFRAICRAIWPDIDSGELPLRSAFPEAQVFLCRNIAERLTIGLKGGHNGEFHNHNDVGSYDIAVGDMLVTGDVGGEIYTKRTFSEDRYVSKVLNSYGHPVPRVNGQLQGTGADYRASVVKTDFTDRRDIIVLDLTKAYQCDELKSLIRTFTCDREGTITITDDVAFTRPCTFEDPLLTLGTFSPFAPQSDNIAWQGQVSRDEAKLGVIIRTSIPGELFTETIDNPGKPPAHVLGVRLAAVTEATVSVSYKTAP